MNPDNERKLFKKFKFLNKKTLSSISCGDGWYKLVYDMCKELKSINPPDDFYITHLAERYGELDVHTVNGVMRTRAVIDEYNTLSVNLCDECGFDRDLQKCDKCTEPEIDYSDSEEDEEEDEGDNSQTSCSVTGKSP